MASTAELDDPLYNLRLSISTSSAPILANTLTPSGPADTVTNLFQASHISFNTEDTHKTFEVTTATRFAPDDKPIDLRSVYFAWLNKDVSITDYVAAVSQLNEDLPSGVGGSVVNLNFAQRIELYAWLNGETESSESIQPLEGAAASAAAGDAAAIAGGRGVPLTKSMGAGGQKMIDVRLLQIYDGERKMGDHNTALRGMKPVDFSAYRKAAATFLRQRPADKPSHPHLSAPLVSNLKKPTGRRSELPIILLSPSASSLLRMSNVKSFLEGGTFIPANATDTQSTNFLQMQRLLPSISSVPMRFILVDSTAMFKPPYGSRVVAIFTTGQPWQFKSYKYQNPSELFEHYPGIYVGWDGEREPESVKSWGRGVMSVQVDKWTGSEKGRWRDREIVERVWGRVEEGMRRGGWTREGPGMSGQGGPGPR